LDSIPVKQTTPVHAGGAQCVGKCWRLNEFKCSVNPTGQDVVDVACDLAVIDEYVVDVDADEGAGFVGVSCRGEHRHVALYGEDRSARPTGMSRPG